MSNKILDAFLDLKYDDVEAIHDSVVEILDSLSGTGGVEKLNEVITVFESGDLSGLFQLEAKNNLEEKRAQYLQVIANLMSAESLLAEYLKYLDNGSDGRLTRNSLYVNFNPADAKTLYDKLEWVVSDNINPLKGIGVDEEVDSEFKREYDYLQGLIDAERAKENPPGNPEQYIIKQSKLVANNTKYKNEAGSMNSLLVSSKERLQQFEMDIKIMTGDIEGFSDIWNVFQFTPDDAQNYVDAHRYDASISKLASYTSDIQEKGFSYTSTEIQELVLGIAAFINGDYEPMVDFLNEELSVKVGADEEEFLANLQDLVSGLLIGANLKALSLPPEDREVFYEKFENLEILSNGIFYLNEATNEVHTDTNTHPNTRVSVDIVGYIRIDSNGILHFTQTSATGDVPIERDIKVNDTDGTRLIQTDMDAWEDAIKDRNIELIKLGIAIVTLGTSIEVGAIAERAFEAIQVIKEVNENSKKIGDIKVANEKTIDDLLGASTDGEGRVIPNFIPIMVVDTFTENGGTFDTYVDTEDNNKIKEVDWSNRNDVEGWINAPYDSSVEDGATNGENLEEIRGEFSDKYDESSDYPAGPWGNEGWNVDGGDRK